MHEKFQLKFSEEYVFGYRILLKYRYEYSVNILYVYFMCNTFVEKLYLIGTLAGRVYE